jgi:Protein of unknown function (DUF3768)
MDYTAKIRALNDALRAIAAGVGRIYVTAGIAALPLQDQIEIMQRVQNFSDFTPNNDPYGEHEFGSFEYGGKKIFWKIDYYDRQLKFCSPDRADESVTTRVLTVLLAEEY